MPNPKIQKVSAPSHIKMCVAAPSGWGKTPFGASTDGVLILSVDPEGTDSAFFAGYDCDVWRARTLDEINEWFFYMRDKGGCSEYRWIVIDSIWEVQNIMLLAAVDDSVKKKPGVQDPFVPDRAHYQKGQLQILDFVKRVNEFPINVLYNTTLDTQMDAEGEDYFMPFLHGQRGDLARQFYGYIPLVGMGEVRESEGKEVRRLWFTKHKAYRGRDRYMACGNYKDNPTLKQIEELVAVKRSKIAEAAGSKTRAVKKTAPAKTAPAARRRAPSAG